MLTFMLTGGFYVSDLDSWISWVKYIGFTFYGNGLLHKLHIDEDSEFFFKMGGTEVYQAIIVMLGMFTTLRILTYKVLKNQTL